MEIRSTDFPSFADRKLNKSIVKPCGNNEQVGYLITTCFSFSSLIYAAPLSSITCHLLSKFRTNGQ
jgi:hypothetical protein